MTRFPVFHGYIWIAAAAVIAVLVVARAILQAVGWWPW